MCRDDEFCLEQYETGGIHGCCHNPLVYHCMARNGCQHPGRECLYIKSGGKRPQDSE